MIYEFRRRIVWKNCREIAPDKTVFVSTINGEFALNGAAKMLTKSKLLITIEIYL